MLMKLGALMLGTYRLIIVISFWCISPFSHMECSSLSGLINISLKSTLSKISIATPAMVLETTGLVNLLPAFHSQPVLLSVDEVGLLYAADVFSIDKYVVIPVM
jgi:hypothetical protein